MHDYGTTYEVKKNCTEEILNDPMYKSISVHLFKNENGYLKPVRAAYLESKNQIVAEFSPNGKFLALFTRETM